MPTSRTAYTSSPRLAAPSLSRVRAWIRWHRRPVSAGLVVLALALLVGELRPAEPPTTTVVTAARDLGAGEAVGPGDVHLTRLAANAVPGGALRAPPTGQLLALPVRSGEVLTDVRLLGDGLLARLEDPDGRERVAVPVHLADEPTAGLLRAGDLVDVVGAGAGGTVVAASSARVLLTPTMPGVVVVAVTSEEAIALARAAVLDRLSFVIRADARVAVP